MWLPFRHERHVFDCADLDRGGRRRFFGALTGVFLAARLSTSMIAVVFGVILLYSVYLELRPRRVRPEAERPDRLAVALRMDGVLPDPVAAQSYHVRRVPLGFGLMYIAGALSGLLGIGSGALKVLAMDQAMGVPFKVSTTTSSFMIGVTAAASAGVYLNRGYIDPGLAAPVMLGVLVGSVIGSRVLLRARPRALRWVFAVVVLALAVEMIRGGLTGGI
jgi:uncharacterized membrane protein YfcA